jgi:hypothetical protein
MQMYHMQAFEFDSSRFSISMILFLLLTPVPSPQSIDKTASVLSFWAADMRETLFASHQGEAYELGN